MSPEQWKRVGAVYDVVRAAPPGDREAILDRECADDSLLRAEVEALLRAESEPDELLDRGVGGMFRPEPGTVLCGRFRLDRLLGEGGMGQVWAALDLTLGELVAIKMLRPALRRDPALAARFKRELQLARRVSHPNVCRVYEFFEEPTTTFLTMELLDGETLEARLRREGPLQRDEAMCVIRHLTAGLAAAHAGGVIHRDLKPGNVMLVQGPREDRPLIMDFGLARAELPCADGGTGSGSVVGTPQYMAPEQITGGPVSTATDIYALGLLIFEIFEGTPPFGGKNTFESWMRRAREGAPTLTRSAPSVHPRANEVVARCLEYDPARRFATADEVWRAFDVPAKVGWRMPRPRRGMLAWAGAMVAAPLAWIWFSPMMPRPPKEALAWYEDAQRALGEGAPDRASLLLRQALSAAPSFAAAHAAMAEASLELDRTTEARESVMRASDLAPDRTRLPAAEALYIEGIGKLIRRECDGAVVALRRRADESADAHRPYALMTLARALDRCDHVPEARKALDEAARLDPRNAAVLVRSATLAARSRDYDAGLKQLDRAESLYHARADFEGVAEVFIARAALETDRDMLDKADASLVKANEMAHAASNSHQQIRVLLQRAVVERKRGALTVAQKTTADALELARRSDLETLTLQGLMTAGNIHLVRYELDEARRLFERALDIATRYRHEGQSARARLSLGSVFVRMGLPQRAAEAIEAARPYYEQIGHKRNLAVAATLMFGVRLLRAEFPEALVEVEREWKNSPEDPAVRERLATLLTEMGRYPEALEHYRAVADSHHKAKMKRQEAYALVNLADVNSRLGLFAEAGTALKSAGDVAAPLGRDPHLDFRRMLTAGLLSMRAGEFAAPASAFKAMLASEGRLPALSIMEARLALCQALTRAGRSGEGRSGCAALSADAAKAGLRATQILADTALAEAELAAGDRGAARASAARVLGPLERAGSVEARIRALAVAAEAARLGKLPSDKVGADLTRALADIRLKWGERLFRSWLSRRDWLVPLDIWIRQKERI